MSEELANRPGDEPLPPITGSGGARLPTLEGGGHVYVTRKAAVWWGMLVSGVASAATGVTELVDYWGLDFVVPKWCGIVLAFVVGAVVAYFVPTRKQVAA